MSNNQERKDGPRDRKRRNKRLFTIGIIVVMLLFVVALFVPFPNSSSDDVTVTTNVGMHALKEYSRIDNVAVNDFTQQVVITFKDRQPYKDKSYKEFAFQYATGQKDELAALLEKGSYANGYTITRNTSDFWATVISSILPLIILIGFFYWISKSSMGGLTKELSKSTTEAEAQSVTFDDVRGEDTALYELQEIRDMMLHPDEYRRAGAVMPKGILLYGQPGTGKTLLARALAGETNSKFYATNGSSFVEMFAGLGAKRVRDLFTKARKNTPAIIFIDEIDAVGGARSRVSSNSEGEQTLNQLLVEMDGFEPNGDVLVIAATNRPDMLDKALLRPGRFDRQVEVDIPDMKGREEILKLHAKNKTVDGAVDMHWVAQQTSGFSGAQLANVMNEAALMSVRNRDETITIADISEGIDRVMAGPQKDRREDYKSTMRHTAYHEGGHAIVAMSMKDADPVTKVTILPRGRALGYTMVSSEDDQTNYTKNQIKAQLAYMMGGRAAEEAVFHEASTGASSDIEKASSLARDAVQKYGFSASMGVGVWDTSRDSPVSESTRTKIDTEIAGMLDEAMYTARIAIAHNRQSLDGLASLLIDKETVTSDDLEPIKNLVDIVDMEDLLPKE